jgi:hypothetical protein
VPVVAFGPPGPSGEMNEGKILWFLKGKVSVDLTNGYFAHFNNEISDKFKQRKFKNKKVYIIFSSL